MLDYDVRWLLCPPDLHFAQMPPRHRVVLVYEKRWWHNTCRLMSWTGINHITPWFITAYVIDGFLLCASLGWKWAVWFDKCIRDHETFTVGEIVAPLTYTVQSASPSAKVRNALTKFDWAAAAQLSFSHWVSTGCGGHTCASYTSVTRIMVLRLTNETRSRLDLWDFEHNYHKWRVSMQRIDATATLSTSS